MELIAAILYFSNYALSAIAVSLAVILFRRYRNCGWLILAGAFTSPFLFLLMRWFSGHRLFSYKTVGPVVDGAASVTYHYDIPGFYLAVVIGLLFFIRDFRHDPSA
jgi:hypothetical protein